MKNHMFLLQKTFNNCIRMSFYAVAKGRIPGIYNTWDECKSQVDKFSGARYKKFATLSAANDFVSEESSSSQPSRNYSGISSKQNSEQKKSLFGEKTKKNNKITNKSRYIPEHSSHPYSRNSSKTAFMTFEGDTDGRVDIFTDGACSNNGTSNAKAGLGVYFGDSHPANLSKKLDGRATNNHAEIRAVIEAAKIAQKNGLKKIRINTDSAFLINCHTKWMKKWETKGWKTASNQPVINKQELIEMKRALEPLDVEFNHVRGHVGIHGNEMADKLAREGAEKN